MAMFNRCRVGDIRVCCCIASRHRRHCLDVHNTDISLSPPSLLVNYSTTDDFRASGIRLTLPLSLYLSIFYTSPSLARSLTHSFTHSEAPFRCVCVYVFIRACVL